MIQFLAVQVRLGNITVEQIRAAKGDEVADAVEALLNFAN